jgi:hypothetical protein
VGNGNGQGNGALLLATRIEKGTDFQTKTLARSQGLARSYESGLRFVANQPFFPLYTGDWKKDPKLSLCSPATRGIWIDLLCSMHDARISQITGTPEQLARLCRCDSGSMHSAIRELQSTGAAFISARDDAYTIVCRRMKRAEELSKARAKSGSEGGSKSASKRQANPEYENESECLKVITEYCSSLGLPESDAEAVFAKWQGNGWTNRGQKIRDWKATIRSWKLQGYLPSQRLSLNGVQSRQMSVFEIEKRVQAINDRINILYREDKEKNKPEIEGLKQSREKLKTQLTQ